MRVTWASITSSSSSFTSSSSGRSSSVHLSEGMKYSGLKRQYLRFESFLRQTQNPILSWNEIYSVEIPMCSILTTFEVLRSGQKHFHGINSPGGFASSLRREDKFDIWIQGIVQQITNGGHQTLWDDLNRYLRSRMGRGGRTAYFAKNQEGIGLLIASISIS